MTLQFATAGKRGLFATEPAQTPYERDLGFYSGTWCAALPLPPPQHSRPQAMSQAMAKAAQTGGCAGVSEALAQAQAVAQAQGQGQAAAGGCCWLCQVFMYMTGW